MSAFEKAAKAMEPRVRLANVNTEEAQAQAACSGIAGLLGQWARSGPVRDAMDSDPQAVVLETSYPSQCPLDSF
jgi:plasmid replication initiation protein